MSVYVGEEFCTLRKLVWPYRFAAHLFADSVEELHAFSESIGLRREWFQNHKRLPHYDVTANKRREAIKAGAVEVDKNMEVTFYNKRIEP